MNYHLAITGSVTQQDLNIICYNPTFISYYLLKYIPTLLKRYIPVFLFKFMSMQAIGATDPAALEKLRGWLTYVRRYVTNLGHNFSSINQLPP